MNASIASINFYAAWIGIFAGLLVGAGLGLFFHDENWLGGYGSWPRRMLRLGHISFFGIAFLNLAFALSLRYLQTSPPMSFASVLLIVGAIAMPTVCFLSAWYQMFRHLFFIPVASLILAVAEIVYRGVVT